MLTFNPRSEHKRRILAISRNSKKLWVQGLAFLLNRSVPTHVGISQECRNAANKAISRDSKKLWVQGLAFLLNRSVHRYVRISQQCRNAANKEFFGSRFNTIAAATLLLSAELFAYGSTTPLKIGCATSLCPVIQEILAEHVPIESSQTYRLIAGASGTHYRQILAGAEIDVLFTADLSYLQLLKQQKSLTDRPIQRFGKGQLVLAWSSSHGREVSLDAAHTYLKTTAKTITMADPKFAPYGQAAMSWLASHKGPFTQYRRLKSRSAAESLRTALQNPELVAFTSASLVATAQRAGKKLSWVPLASPGHSTSLQSGYLLISDQPRHRSQLAQYTTWFRALSPNDWQRLGMKAPGLP